MFRLYKSVVERMFISLLYQRYAGGTDFGRMAEWTFGNLIKIHPGVWREEETANLQRIAAQVSNIRQTHRYGFNHEEGLDDLIKNVLTLLEKANGHFNDGDLIDAIVGTLGLPHSKNVLSGRTFEYLKEALMIPDELSKLRGRLGTREMSCSGCGHEFVSGEMASCVNEGGGGWTFMCPTCWKPEFRTCNKCSKSMHLDNRIFKAVSKGTTCEECLGTAKPEEAVTIQDPAVLAGGRRSGRRPMMSIPEPYRREYREREGRHGQGAALPDPQAPPRITTEDIWGDVHDRGERVLGAFELANAQTQARTEPAPITIAERLRRAAENMTLIDRDFQQTAGPTTRDDTDGRG